VNTNIEAAADPKNEFKYWRIAAWCGPMFMGCYMLFWGTCHNYPPMSPALTAEQVQAIFMQDHLWFKFGMVICMSFTICYAVWSIAMSKVMGKVVGKDSILCDMQVWGGGLTAVPLLVTSAFWLSAGFRPEMPATQVQLLLDTAWMLLDLAYSTTTVQMFAMGVAWLSDKREKPLVPAWVAWYAIWVGFAFVAEIFMPFFREGFFARQGVLNFWIEFGIWFAWAWIVSYYVIKAIPRLEQEAVTRVVRLKGRIAKIDEEGNLVASA